MSKEREPLISDDVNAEWERAIDVVGEELSDPDDSQEPDPDCNDCCGEGVVEYGRRGYNDPDTVTAPCHCTGRF